MRIGEAFHYEVEGQQRIVRRERGRYLTYIASADHFCSFGELVYRVVRDTVSDRLGRLVKCFVRELNVSPDDARALIAEAQEDLVEKGVLAREHCNADKGGKRRCRSTSAS